MAQNYVYPASSNVTLTGSTNGSPIPPTSIVVGGENPSGNTQPLQTDASGALIVSPLTTTSTVTVVQPNGTLLHATIDASALPTGASTSALQTSGNASLTSIDGKLGSLGQKTSAGSAPVVLASDQSSIPVTFAGNVTVVQPTGTNLHTVVDSGSITVSNFPATQPVSGTVTVVQPTGTNLHAVLDATSTTTVTQATGTNLHTVVDSGTVVVTQPTGTNLHVAVDSIAAGSNIIGNVRIDQTTPGTTNGVQVNAALPAGTNTIGNVRAATPTALTITQAALTVGTTAVRLTVSGSAPSATRVSLVATPDVASTATFYIGSSSVTNSGATRGVEIKAGQAFIANSDAGDYYIVSSTAAQTVTVLEQA